MQHVSTDNPRAPRVVRSKPHTESLRVQEDEALECMQICINHYEWGELVV